jgi:hypothetical protein
MTEQELLADTLRRLNQAGIAYMLTGSMASNFWGIPRTTHDLDFVYMRERAQELRLSDELKKVLSGEPRPKST